MNHWLWITIITAAVFIVCGIVYGLYWQQKTKKTMKKLNDMLELAINGDFTETTFDETTLSALEAKLNRYLSQSAVSSKNLKREKNEIETLISDISHQTKTPIANILLYSELLEESPLSEEGKISVQALSAQAEKLKFLIGALVKTSRLETGIIEVTAKKNDVAALLQTVVEEITPKAEGKNIALILEEVEGEALFDSKWTAEALYNIVDNGVKYTPVGGEIRLSANRYELFFRIDIADNGIGIAEEEQAKIFTRFYRSPMVLGEEGVGIGLYLSREIITAQGGYIKVVSQQGQGTVFSVYLPTP